MGKKTTFAKNQNYAIQTIHIIPYLSDHYPILAHFNVGE